MLYTLKIPERWNFETRDRNHGTSPSHMTAKLSHRAIFTNHAWHDKITPHIYSKLQMFHIKYTQIKYKNHGTFKIKLIKLILFNRIKYY